VHTKEFATMALDKSAIADLLDALRAGGDLDVIREGLALVLQALIDAEATQHIGAGRYERTDTRTAHRNGTRCVVGLSRVTVSCDSLDDGVFRDER
jgi:transposase-like protein